MEKTLKDYFEIKKSIVEDSLTSYLPAQGSYPETIHSAMSYSLMGGGKRLRPILVITAFEALNGLNDNLDDVLKTGGAIEMLHTFSLIHDDLPCMDDDDLRRGQPTCHKKFGEAIAVLAGDALCIHAFTLISTIKNGQLVSLLGKALGTSGMIGGQVVDILSEGQIVDRKTLEYIHLHKTAALIEASLNCGAMLANASTDNLKKISVFGNKIGLAFQVVDDILDIESTTETLGKDVGSDVENEKSTYPALIGLEKSKKYAADLISDSKDAIHGLSGDPKMLELLADYILTRVN